MAEEPPDSLLHLLASPWVREASRGNMLLVWARAQDKELEKLWAKVERAKREVVSRKAAAEQAAAELDILKTVNKQYEDKAVEQAKLSVEIQSERVERRFYEEEVRQVKLMATGMGRTCVYIHHVDKDAFLKGNIDPDPDELDMVFDLCPSYAELLEQVRKDLNWMDPSDVVEFAGRHNVGFGMHIRWKTMRVNSEQRWLAYKDTVAESLDKALELFAMKTNVPNLLDLNRVSSSIVEAIPATINEEASIEPLSCVYEANEEVNIEHEPLVEANYEHYDDGNVLHDNNLGDLDKYNLQETMDHSIPYSRGYASESDDEGPDEEVDEEGFTAKEAEAFTKGTTEEGVRRKRRSPKTMIPGQANQVLANQVLANQVQANKGRVKEARANKFLLNVFLADLGLLEDVLLEEVVVVEAVVG
ncbi:hypothetical protein D1007_60807 [Hordeum vulgare]|nr:hypothetical protein D1007_60807 [Hordeum vulgare]